MLRIAPYSGPCRNHEQFQDCLRLHFGWGGQLGRDPSSHTGSETCATNSLRRVAVDDTSGSCRIDGISDQGGTAQPCKGETEHLPAISPGQLDSSGNVCRSQPAEPDVNCSAVPGDVSLEPIT